MLRGRSAQTLHFLVAFSSRIVTQHAHEPTMFQIGISVVGGHSRRAHRKQHFKTTTIEMIYHLLDTADMPNVTTVIALLSL